MARWELVNLAGELPPLPDGAAEKIAAILREAEARTEKAVIPLRFDRQYPGSVRPSIKKRRLSDCGS